MKINLTSSPIAFLFLKEWVLFCFLSTLIFSVQAHSKSIQLLPHEVEALIHEHIANLKEGDQLLLPSGTFSIDRPISFAGRNATIKGAGINKTLLDFSKQRKGAQAVLLRGWDLTLEGMSIHHPKGDGVVVRNSMRVLLKDLAIHMARPVPSDIGAYALYPVTSRHITISNVLTSGASEAGIYLGQSRNAVIRDSYATHNGAGLNIENSTHVSVFNNDFSGNALGGLIVSIPDLMFPYASDIKLINNTFKNNHARNRANEKTIVNKMGEGIGLALVAAKNIWLNNNHVSLHSNNEIDISGYRALELPPSPKTFDTHPKNIYLFNSTAKISTNYSKASCINTDADVEPHACVECNCPAPELPTYRVDLPLRSLN